MYNKPPEKVTDLKAIDDLSAKELYLAFDQNEEAAMAKYQEKAISVHGVIDSILTNESGGLIIMLSTEGEMGSIQCELDSSSKPVSENLKKGDEITIKGICSGKLIDVVLNRCVVIK